MECRAGGGGRTFEPQGKGAVVGGHVWTPVVKAFRAAYLTQARVVPRGLCVQKVITRGTLGECLAFRLRVPQVGAQPPLWPMAAQIKHVLTLVGTPMDSLLTTWTAVWGVVSAGGLTHCGNNREVGMSRVGGPRGVDGW